MVDASQDYVTWAAFKWFAGIGISIIVTVFGALFRVISNIQKAQSDSVKDRVNDAQVYVTKDDLSTLQQHIDTRFSELTQLVAGVLHGKRN